MMTKNLVFSAEAGRLLDVTPNTIRVLARRGHLPTALQIGDVRLFDREQVLRLAVQRQRAAEDRSLR